MLDNLFTMSFLLMIIRLATPIFFASMSSYIAASTGIGNIAIEGIMTMSALFGVLGAFWTQSSWLGVLIGILVGIIIAVGIAFFSMRLGASPMLVGIAMNTFADSLAIFILYQVTGEKGTTAALKTPAIPTVNIPFLKDIPIVGEVLSGQGALTYICWILIIVFFIIIFKTPLGMRMRACGLNPDAAQTAGINVKKLQVLSLVFSGILAALGGVYMSLNYLHIYSKSMIAGQGWMGIAANGIASGNYGTLLITSFAFAIFRAISIGFGTDSKFPTDLVSGVPYFAVFAGLVIFSIISTYRLKKGKVEDK